MFFNAIRDCLNCYVQDVCEMNYNSIHTNYDVDLDNSHHKLKTKIELYHCPVCNDYYIFDLLFQN